MYARKTKQYIIIWFTSLLFSFIAFSHNYVSAQNELPAWVNKKNLYPGYVVKFNNDTLKGYIHVTFFTSRYKEVTFVDKAGNEQKKLTAEELRAYGYTSDTTHKFVRLLIPTSDKEAEYYEVFGEIILCINNVTLYKHVLTDAKEYPAIRNINLGQYRNLYFIRKGDKLPQLLGAELMALNLNVYLGSCKEFSLKYPKGIKYDDKFIKEAILYHVQTCKQN